MRGLVAWVVIITIVVCIIIPLILQALVSRELRMRELWGWLRHREIETMLERVLSWL